MGVAGIDSEIFLTTGAAVGDGVGLGDFEGLVVGEVVGDGDGELLPPQPLTMSSTTVCGLASWLYAVMATTGLQGCCGAV